eukprot:Amastigsp_a685005_24.p3 type:complete len:124 gc:universal Amastigsp_a685005_24:123-494(+)
MSFVGVKVLGRSPPRRTPRTRTWPSGSDTARRVDSMISFGTHPRLTMTTEPSVRRNGVTMCAPGRPSESRGATTISRPWRNSPSMTTREYSRFSRTSASDGDPNTSGSCLIRLLIFSSSSFFQ